MRLSSLWVGALVVLGLSFSHGASAQALSAAQDFADLSASAEALADNAAQNSTGGLASVFARQRCVSGYTFDGKQGALALTVGMTNYRLFNPDTNSFDTVSMRSYNGCPAGPTLSVKPGMRLDVTLNNRLPAESPATCPPNPDPAAPHCFNTTNLHTHGLHVSPSGHADNVMVSVAPNASFDYRFEIPASHPAGTFWYHSHQHGSTAIDVSSGMAGVLIVRGSRTAAARAANGGIADIDTILHRRERQQPFREHVMLFQQIEYGCFDNATASAPLANPATQAWVCPPGGVGEIRNYTNQLNFVADPRPGHAGEFNSTWAISGRYTQINGVVQPVFPGVASYVPAGEIRRWRMIHGGNRDTINVKIVRANLPALGLADSPALSTGDVDSATRAAASRLSAAHGRAQQTTLDALCNGETVKQVEIAVDGLTRASMVEKDVNTLDPGYRSDVLVAFPQPGLYCILDEAASAAATINFRRHSASVKDRRLLAFARVGPGTNIPAYVDDGLGHSKYWQYVRNQLVDANQNLPRDVLADLNRLDTRAFAPPRVTDGVPARTVPVAFDVDTSSGAPHFVINDRLYDMSRIDHTATLGTLEEWRVSATVAGGGHVFHIHVNPFRVADVLNPAGQSIYDSTGACTQAELATGDAEYCTQRDVLRDTVFVKPGYTLVLRTRYEDFTGQFVMHCHILDHEDQGMMQNVAIVAAQGTGSAGLPAGANGGNGANGSKLAQLLKPTGIAALPVIGDLLAKLFGTASNQLDAALAASLCKGSR
ncbi:copper oxidase [Burkholderia sp. SRS-W-2-2016]|uniref:multicopper oxidase family protein n=1 Tax=Burkholderia sp. SRS-W-2-2016 TaxID=1926878 RepID=UPI00094B1812|nr:multicopper oxidase domain-containing protein [Burkholderia sp. SRS-W-2-2016]OLL27979.1 copper oxidase [Burkholderia sp. SRS-W-2-2016]